MSTYKRVSGNLTIKTLSANDVVTIDAATVAVTGNLTVAGNATLAGNVVIDAIVNGTTSIEIPSVNGNATVSIGGVSNVVVFTSTGFVTTGNSSVSGNITSGNTSVTGNVTGGNVNSLGNVFVTQNAATSTPTVRLISSNTSEASGTVLGSYEWYTSDTSAPGARTVAAIRANVTDAAGNARVDILTGTSATLTSRVTILPSGNVGISNVAPIHGFAVTGTGYYSSALTVVGNVTGGNINTAGLVSAAGNVVSGGNIVATGYATVTGNVTGGNVISLGGISAGSGGVSATGNVTGGNISTNGVISAAGNLTTTDITATSLSATGNVTSGNIFSLGIFNAVGNITGANINANSDVVAGNVRTVGLVSATGTINSGNIISAAGNVVTGSNLVAAGNIVANSGGFFVGDGGFLSNVTAASNVAVTQIANGTTNFSVAGTNGNITAAVNGVSNVVVINSTALVANTTLSATGNVIGGNILTGGIISATGNITGANINGSGVGLSSLTGANVTGTVANATYAVSAGSATSATTAGTVTTNAQPNITSVGTLSSLSVTGNITGANINGSGVGLSSLTGANVTGTVANATYAVSAGSATTAGTVTINAQPNITSVGTLTTLSVGTGNITGGNLLISGAIIDSAQLDIQTSAANANIVLTPNGTGNVNIDRMSASGNITAVAFHGDGSGLNNVRAANIAVSTSTANTTFAVALVNQSGSPSDVVRDTSLTYNPSTDEMFTGGLAGLFAPYLVNVRASTSSTSTATGALRVQGGVGIVGNVYAGAFYGAATGLTAIPGANVTGTVANAGTVTTNAQPNITSVGTLSSLTVTANVSGGNILTGGLISAAGNITGGNLSAGTGTVSGGNIVNTNANGVGNIGSSTIYFDTVFAKATSAQYADLAEKYLADADYEPGTVLVFGGEQEVTADATDTDTRVAGVVSENPSYLMNSGLNGQNVVVLALLGRVYCKVTGPVTKGDLLVTAGSGQARVNNNAPSGTIVGKSLQNFNGDSGVIEIVVGRT